MTDSQPVVRGMQTFLEGTRQANLSTVSDHFVT